MSKPEFAAEPSMEEILSSIRKMISDEPVGAPPVPDRFPSGPEAGPATHGMGADRWDGQVGPLSNTPERPVPSYNRLSEALKTASAPSFEPSRTLEEEIAEMLGKGSPPGGEDAMPSEYAGPARGDETQEFAAAPAEFGRPLDAPAAPNPSTVQPIAPEPQAAPMAQQDSERVFDPHQPDVVARSEADVGKAGADIEDIEASVEIRPVTPSANVSDDEQGSSQSADVDPLPSAEAVPLKQAFALRTGDAAAAKKVGASAARVEVRAPRAAPASSGLNGATVSPIRPRPVIVERTETPSAPQKSTKPSPAAEAPTAATSKVGGQLAPQKDAAAKPEPSAAKPANQNGAPSEALLDAVVNLVQKEPGSMSVFTSGSDFIHGIGRPHDDPDSPVHKLDGAAAELLRPMLRQWLSDNMPRIVEEALRSELQSSGGDKDGSKKS